MTTPVHARSTALHPFDAQCGHTAPASSATTIKGRGVKQVDLNPLTNSLPAALGPTFSSMYFGGPGNARLVVLVTNESRIRTLLANTPKALCTHIDTILAPYSQHDLRVIASALTNDARATHLVINQLSPDPKTDRLVVQVPAHALDAAGHTGTPDPAANEARVRAAAKPYGGAVVITTGDRIVAHTF